MKPRIAIISFPWESNAPYKFLSNLIEILEPITERVIIIDGNTERIKINSKKVDCLDIHVGLHYLKDKNPIIYSAVFWIIKCLYVQIAESIKLISVRNEINVVIFYMSYPYFILPFITSKILRKRTIEVITREKPRALSSKVMSLQDHFVWTFIDGISPESEKLLCILNLKRYKKKFLPEGSRFIDIEYYKPKKSINERRNLVGFIGRIRKDKGIMEFIESIPLIKRDVPNVEFLIAGSGDLLDWVKEECRVLKLKGLNIEVTGWIGNDLPDYLSELKLLVLPTYADALPTIILEAMACGTPVIATSVGAISDIIVDCETGFLLEDRSPESISRKVVDSINRDDLSGVSNNARRLVEMKFSYKMAVNRWINILGGNE